MSEITDKSTKAEILAAYAILKAENENLQQAIVTKEKPDTETVKENIVPNLSEKPDIVSVVIPYVKAFAQGNELQLAVRGWAENFKENFNMVIVGDREPWMGENIIVIDSPCVGDNPPIDIAHKLLKVIDAPMFRKNSFGQTTTNTLLLNANWPILKHSNAAVSLAEQSLGAHYTNRTKSGHIVYSKAWVWACGISLLTYPLFMRRKSFCN